MATVFDRVGMATTTSGTGTLTLGSALGNVSPNLASFMSFAAAGVSNNQLVSYLILDSNNNWEVGIGTYTAPGTTLTRNVLFSSNSNNPINLSGNAQVFITEIAEDANQAVFGGYRNRFRNGTYDVAQRGTSGSVSAGATAYTLDGWLVTAAGAAVAWNQEYATSIAANHLVLTCASGITAATLTQRIESLVAIAMLLGGGSAQPVTVQWTVFNNSGSSFTPQITSQYPTSQDNFNSLTTDLALTNLQPCPNAQVTTVAYTFVPATNCFNGYQIQLALGAALNHVTGNIKIGLADVRVTPGVATGINNNPPPPEMRPVQIELLFSQRYYRRRNFSGNESIAMLQAVSATQANGKLFDWDPPMRAAPAPGISSASHFSGQGAAGGGTPVGTFNLSSDPNSLSIGGVPASFPGAAFVAGNAILLFANNASAWIDLSAEL
jgi:hypothetical protein